ncbi:sulfite exporter TauE/SafE family protein [Salininema proteolyticum]|uniref:Probable membrane transporter protein n=1 Tax=Salininema proteolyticum TaxID=1607685 RepID=A0ABV8TW04_9ACTN
MVTLLVSFVGGLSAQALNGALGLGFGAVAMTVLLGAGITPLIASATVNVAAAGAGVAGGLAHWRFGNLHWGLTWRLAMPGAVGGFLGASALSHLAVATTAPVTALVLMALGGFIIVRFSRGVPEGRRQRLGWAWPAGVVGGLVNGLGGMGWGPVATSTVLLGSGLAPAQVVASVSTARAAVALSVVGGFWWSLSSTLAVLWPIALGLVLGGALMAPFAAWIAKRLPPARLGIAVGATLIAVNGFLLAMECGLVL